MISRKRRHVDRYFIYFSTIVILILMIACSKKTHQRQTEMEKGGATENSKEAEQRNQRNLVDSEVIRFCNKEISIDAEVIAPSLQATKVLQRFPSLADKKEPAIAICNPKEITSLEPLSELKHIKALFLPNSSVRDFKPLTNFTDLLALDLDETVISDLSPLRNLSNLSTLTLRKTNVSDIEPLSKLTQLNVLILSDTKIQNLNPITDLKNLTFLTVSGTKVSNFGPIRNLKQLKALDLMNTRIVDLSPIAELENLTELILPDCELPDISVLSKMKNLKQLVLMGEVPKEQIDFLKEKLPDLTVH